MEASKVFELVLGLDGLASREGDLVLVEHEGGSMVNPDGSSSILRRVLLLAIGMGKAAWCG